MNITNLFTDQSVIQKIQSRLPELFYIAELESSRAGKIGMEVGSVRERILIALLIYKFGKDNVETEIPIIEPEIDVKVFSQPISIKTITGKRIGGVKLVWTVDAEKARRFSQEYHPRCDILLVQINWGGAGGFFFIPQSTQLQILDELGRSNYFTLPKPGTNPRGVEISKQALARLTKHPKTISIPILWRRTRVDYNPYERWLEFWKKE